MKQTARLAFSGMLCALSLGCLLLTFFPFATYALPALAGVFLVPIVVECSKATALYSYVAVSLLALITVPDMEAKALFIAFFGYYPVLKAAAESLRSRLAEWSLKLLVFNVAVVIAYTVLANVGFSLQEFAIPQLPLSLGTVLLLFLVAGNVVFILYDIGLTRFLPLYFGRLQPVLSRLFG